MNVVKWTIGLAVIALGASPVLAQSAIQTAFDYKLTGYSCSDEPSCCAADECCDGCDSCCGDDCCDACGDGCCDACGDGCCDACGCGGGCALGGMLPCSPGDPCTILQDNLCGNCPWMGIQIGGWTSLGYHNEQTPLSASFGDVLAFNDVPNQLNLHQQWLWAEKVADGSNGIGFGGRIDFLYGTDAQKTQAFGNPPGSFDFLNGFDHGEYGFAIPQLYGEVAFNEDLSVIAGHFYTLLGYEVVQATGNFFYSHSLTSFNSEAFTHTGVLATYGGFEDFEVYAGWTLGWDTGFDQAFGGSSWLGGFSTSLSDNVAFTYISTAGNLGARSGGANGYTHSLLFDVTLSDNLNYVVQSDLVSIDNEDPDFVANGGFGEDQVGLNQYLFYTLSDCLTVGTRLEWWKADGQSFQEMTWGLNYRPIPNMVFRPEIRYDWTESSAGFPNDAAAGLIPRDEETTFGMDCVITY